ncbi:MAG TPA: DegT/DnrJ/EryC1/StrS family aminotransferase [Terriglobales bacterium]
MALAQEIVSLVRSVVGPGNKQLHKPDIGWREMQYVNEAMTSGYVADGPFIKRFEDKLCEVTGARYAVAVSSGTAALHLAMRDAFVKDARDFRRDCVLPSLTFIATANAATYCGLELRFSDDIPSVTVDILGRVRPERFGVLVEDACQALGSKGAGRQGVLACFSFNGNKICTTGGGGAVVTDDAHAAARVRHLATQAKDPSDRMSHDAIGFNYRMPNLNAALGLAQLERLPEFLERKQRLADRYERALGELFWKPPAGSNNWLNAIRVPKGERDNVLKALNDAGYESRSLHTPLHLLPIYAGFPREDMSRTEAMWNTTVCLPSGAGLA